MFCKPIESLTYSDPRYSLATLTEPFSISYFIESQSFPINYPLNRLYLHRQLMELLLIKNPRLYLNKKFTAKISGNSFFA